MATVVLGAAVGALYASSAAVSMTVLTGALLGGAMGFAGSALTDTPDQPSPIAQPQDKTTAEREDELQALEIGDKGKKRKRSGSKSKFKIPTTTLGENVGVALASSTPPKDTSIAGVQL